MTSYATRRAGARNGARLAEQAIRDERDRQARERVEHDAKISEARVAARKAEAERHKFTADELRDAAIVRDEFGWHRVIKVNAKTVTVPTPYSWTDRIPLAKVLDWRPAPEPAPTEADWQTEIRRSRAQ